MSDTGEQAIHVDSNVPIPEDNPHSKKWPLRTLKVGESFEFPSNKRTSVAALAIRIRREGVKDFVIRKVDEDNHRVWRIK